jgi:hypothetical protein
LGRLCTDPEIVAPLFETKLPETIEKARIVFWGHRFTTPSEKEETGHWWLRKEMMGYLKDHHPQVSNQLKSAQPEPIKCRGMLR